MLALIFPSTFGPPMRARLIALGCGKTVLLVGLLLLAGCQSCDAPEEDESAPLVAPTERGIGEQLDPRALATRYLRYAYEGALLSSDHPLNDSLSALAASPIGGRGLTVIDTFSVESVQTVEDSGHVVEIQFPRSVRIQSVTWETSAPTIDERHSLRVYENKVHEAPHVVGWPAFQRHLRDVAPEAADSVLERTSSKLKRPPGGT